MKKCCFFLNEACLYSKTGSYLKGSFIIFRFSTLKQSKIDVWCYDIMTFFDQCN